MMCTRRVNFPLLSVSGPLQGGLLALKQFLSHVPFNIGPASDAVPCLRTGQDRPWTLLDNASL